MRSGRRARTPAQVSQASSRGAAQRGARGPARRSRRGPAASQRSASSRGGARARAGAAVAEPAPPAGSRCRRRRVERRGERRDHRRRVLVGEDRQAGDDRAAVGERRAAPRRAPPRRRGCGRRRRRSAGSSAISSSRPGTIRLGGDRGDRARVELRRGRPRRRPRRGRSCGAGRGPRRRARTSGAGVLGATDQAGAALGGGAARRARATSGETRPRTRVDCVAQDGQLLGGDLELGLPQPLGVVEADRGEDGDPRGDRVGRVEPAAEPGLDRRRLHPGARPGRRRWPRSPPRTGSPPRPRSRRAVDALGGRGDWARRRRPRPAGAISSPPISVRSVQRVGVRGEAGAGGDAVRFQQRRDHPRHRGLAVGADDVDRGEAVLRAGRAPCVSCCIRSRPSRQPIGSSESR